MINNSLKPIYKNLLMNMVKLGLNKRKLNPYLLSDTYTFLWKFNT